MGYKKSSFILENDTDSCKIHTLLAAIRTGSFRRAALELNCTQFSCRAFSDPKP